MGQPVHIVTHSTEFRVALSNREEMPLSLYEPKRFDLPSWSASVAQLVEHLHGVQDVTHSSPACGNSPCLYDQSIMSTESYM